MRFWPESDTNFTLRHPGGEILASPQSLAILHAANSTFNWLMMENGAVASTQPLS